MKLTVQVIKNHEEYSIEYDKWKNDPMIYAKPEMEVEYEDMNMLDMDIYAYKVTPSIVREGEMDIVIYTDANHLEVLSVDYSEELIEQLDSLLRFHNDKYYKS